MAPTTPRLRILSVGGNSVSAFLSWRLSATNACDVTLVWKSGFDSVSQYGISFRSSKFGNERFKPRHVVRTPEEAAGASRASFDYVVLCVKALPDVYDLASVIESVVSPQHTCILVNTTHSLGIESYLEQRFPTNVVLSLVSGAEITQLGSAEFEHKGSTELWVGAANRNPAIPATIQQDMAEALAMTLKSGQVDCEVSPNIRQQQYERMIGNIAFHPASVVFETPSHAELLEKVGVRGLIGGVIDELLAIAKAQGCQFNPGYREKVMEQMILPADANSTMYQDFLARRPMEVETYLGSPIKLAQEVGVPAPRIETLYALLHNANVINQKRPPPSEAAVPQAQTQPPPSLPPTRISSAPNGPPMPASMRGPMPGQGPMGRPSMPNGIPPPRSRAQSTAGPPPGMRRNPHSMPGQMNGFPPPRGMNGNSYGPRGHGPRRHTDMDENGLEEFSHLMLYDDMVEDGGAGPHDIPNGAGGDMAIRERELALRQKELALREREYNMNNVRRPRMPPAAYDDDDDEDGADFFDPMGGPTMNGPEADNIDMMSVTSRRTRKAPSAGQLRANPEMNSGMGGSMSNGRGPWKRPPPSKNRTSATLMNELPNLRDQLMNNPLMGYSSDRYGNVDRHNMGVESRTNSLTAERLNELQHGPGGPGPNGFNSGPFPGPASRRGSQSPGNLLNGANGSITPRANLRPSPPNGVLYTNGRPSPPGMRQPIPRYPPGQGNAAPPPQQLEQQHQNSNGMGVGMGVGAGVSTSLHPNKAMQAPSVPSRGQSQQPQPQQQQQQVRSLTGSASASAGSGDSYRSSADRVGGVGGADSSEPSTTAHSSSSSLGPRPAIGVR